MEKLTLEISVKMINICQKIDEAKLEKLEYIEEKLKLELGELIFKAMEDCPF